MAKWLKKVEALGVARGAKCMDLVTSHVVLEYECAWRRHDHAHLGLVLRLSAIAQSKGEGVHFKHG